MKCWRKRGESAVYPAIILCTYPLSAHALAMRYPVQICRTMISAYAMSGTDIAHAACSYLACYAVSGTEIAYAAPRKAVSG
eukprot:2843438-Rhodomonas_salina.2